MKSVYPVPVIIWCASILEASAKLAPSPLPKERLKLRMSKKRIHTITLCFIRLCAYVASHPTGHNTHKHTDSSPCCSLSLSLSFFHPERLTLADSFSVGWLPLCFFLYPPPFCILAVARVDSCVAKFVSLFFSVLSHPSGLPASITCEEHRMLLFVCVLWFVLLAILCRLRRWGVFSSNTVGFLHASSGAGGGGERVLWVAIQAVQEEDEKRGVKRQYVLYTNRYSAKGLDENATDRDLLDLVATQFKIRLPAPLHCVYLNPRLTRWLSGDAYPRLTLLLQTVVGGTLLFIACAVLNPCTPIIVETVGVPMVYPLLRLLAGSEVVSYTHYPIISDVMISRVRTATVSTTNNGLAVKSGLVRRLKHVYYVCFASFYRVLGLFPVVVFTNSSWTQARVSRAYWPRASTILYPPCDTASLMDGAKAPTDRTNDIVSVGQFRPEKDHSLQLHAFAAALDRLPNDSRLILVGGVRNAADEQRVAELRQLAESLAVSDRVVFHINAPFETVRSLLHSSSIGLHTMVDEHFGIVILEYMAAGCIPLANRSGGVMLDIVKDETLGFLAQDVQEYANAMVAIIHMKQTAPTVYSSFQSRMAAHVRTFDDASFSTHFVAHLDSILYAQ